MKKGRLTLMMLTALLAIPACGGSGGGEGPQSQIVISDTSLEMIVGEEHTLTATAPEGETLRWSSSNTDVVTVDGGKLTAISVGEAVITVKIMGTNDKATCSVKVSPLSEDSFIKTPTEITVTTTFNDTFGQIFKDTIEEMKKKEPLLTINYVKFGGKYDALREEVINGIPAGNYPDVVVAYPDGVADFIEAGVQLDMEPYMDNPSYGWTETEKADVFEQYLEEGQNYSVPGTLSLPIAKSTEGMYYDGEKLIGIKLDGINDGNPLTEEYFNNLTWEELFNELCPALLDYRETLPADQKAAFLDTETFSDWALVGYDSDDNLFITLAEQYGYGYTSFDPVTGTGLIDFNNSNMKSLMKFLRTAYEKKYLTTQGTLGTNTNKRSNADAMLFCIGSTGGVSYQFDSKNAKSMKIAKLPHPATSTGKFKMISQGPSLAFLDHGNENRALGAWLFYKELSSVETNAAWSTTTGYSPIRESVLYSDEYLRYMDEELYNEKTLDHLKALNAQYINETANDLFVSPVFKGSSEARKQAGGLVTDCLMKALESGQTLDEMIDSLFETAYNAVILKM